MPIKCRDLIKLVEKIAHPKHAENWDKIGLQIGDPDSIIQKVMVTLDATLPVIEEGVREKVDFLMVHHTPMFNPLETIRWDKPQGKLIKKLVESNINLYCAHTNLDSVSGGINDILAEILGLQNIQVLAPNWEEKYFKIVVFVPQGYEDQVRNAMTQKGAGYIGNYSDCSYQVFGTGTFRPLEGTNPFIGEQGQLEKAEEYRIETIVPRERLDEVVKAMLAVHPYEEVAYDLYPLANKAAHSGLGRIGSLESTLTLGQLIEKVKDSLSIQDIRFVGDLNTQVQKIAVCGGSGASLIKKAIDKGAQVLITGDIKYHEAQDAESMGLALIDAGHFATEHPVVQVVADYLRRALAGQDVEIIESQINTNPIKFYKG